MDTPIDKIGATPKHWKYLKGIRNHPVEPRDFRDRWNLTNEQIARLLDLKVGHVNCWFFEKSASRYREPKEGHKQRLAEIDFIWSLLDTFPDHLIKHYTESKEN